MIKNFEEVKKQLSELSSLINSFKSETVQLRIVELIFDFNNEQEIERQSEQVSNGSEKKKKRRVRKNGSVTPKETSEGKKKNAKMASGDGPVSTLIKLAEGDFFKKSRTIGDIIKHCEVNLARRFKPQDMSGKLARMVRDGELKRMKNSENQYEYIKA